MEFFIKCEEEAKLEDIVCKIDVYNHQDEKTITEKNIKFSELSLEHYKKMSLNFNLDETQFGLEFRLFSTGQCALSAYFKIELYEKI